MRRNRRSFQSRRTGGLVSGRGYGTTWGDESDTPAQPARQYRGFLQSGQSRVDRREDNNNVETRLANINLLVASWFSWGRCETDSNASAMSSSAFLTERIAKDLKKSYITHEEVIKSAA